MRKIDKLLIFAVPMTLRSLRGIIMSEYIRLTVCKKKKRREAAGTIMAAYSSLLIHYLIPMALVLLSTFWSVLSYSRSAKA